MGNVTQKEKTDLKEDFKKTSFSKNRNYTLADRNNEEIIKLRKEVEALKKKFKTRGFTAGEIIFITILTILGSIVLAGVIGVIVSANSPATSPIRSFDFGKKITKKNRFFKKINNQLKKDYIKAIKRRKKLKFNKSDRKKIKEIQKKLSKKGYTKIEIAGIMISIVMKIPVKVGIQYVSNLVKTIVK